MHAQLARLLLTIADDLDKRCYPATGALRQAAGVLSGLTERGRDACPVCGGVIAQPATGRRRSYCSRRCRDAATRHPRGETASKDHA